MKKTAKKGTKNKETASEFIAKINKFIGSNSLPIMAMMMVIILAMLACIAIQSANLNKTEYIKENMTEYVTEYVVEEKVAYVSEGVCSNILYTEFDMMNGWWGADGELEPVPEGKMRKHSQMIPVLGGYTYYLGYCFSETDVPVSGGFFDKDGNWLAPLMTVDIEQYYYFNADGNGRATDFVDLYKFTAPKGTHFFSYNLSTSNKYSYRQFVASKPVFALKNTGNYAFSDDFPPYQAHKDKNLCVIGASGVELNRALRDVSTILEQPDEQYIVGFQEYLVPWYNLVESYGFAGGGWRKNDEAKRTSIYKGIIEKNVDLSSYDEFLLFPATNDMEMENIGEIDSTDPTTYMGSLNAMIEKIYEESPNAKIYLANAAHKGSYYTSKGGRKKIDTLNTALAEIADYYSLQLIDLAGGSGINKFNYAQGKMTYDGTHLNQEGSKLTGLYLRKEMIGF